MSDYADIWEQQEVVARKDYRCDISGARIPKGQKHTKISCLFDGGWSHLRAHTCFIGFLSEINKGQHPDDQVSPFEFWELDFTAEDRWELYLVFIKNHIYCNRRTLLGSEIETDIARAECDKMYAENKDLREEIERLNQREES